MALRNQTPAPWLNFRHLLYHHAFALKKKRGREQIFSRFSQASFFGQQKTVSPGQVFPPSALPCCCRCCCHCHRPLCCEIYLLPLLMLRTARSAAKGVPEAISACEGEVYVVTTKQTRFASALLDHAGERSTYQSPGERESATQLGGCGSLAQPCRLVLFNAFGACLLLRASILCLWFVCVSVCVCAWFSSLTRRKLLWNQAIAPLGSLYRGERGPGGCTQGRQSSYASYSVYFNFPALRQRPCFLKSSS